MMKKIILFLIAIGSIKLNAQSLRFNIGSGFANYAGDLQEKYFTLKQARGVISAGGSLSITPHFSIRSDYSFAQVGADDKFSSKQVLRDRNLNFKSLIHELSIVGEINLLDPEFYKITPFGYAGVGIFNFSPYTNDANGNKVYLAPLGTEGQGTSMYPERKMYKTTQYNIPFGGGLKYTLSDDVQVSGEFGIRYLHTDYLDDVSLTYADKDVLLAERGARSVELAFRGDELQNNPHAYPNAGAPRGSAKSKDLYYFGQLRLSIRLNWFDNGGNYGRSKVGCPRRL